MSLVACPECKADVSNTATKCPSCGFTIRKPRRGFFGTIFKWLFILFNVVMVIWLFTYWGSIGDMMNNSASDAEQAGAALGATMGTGMLFMMWALGDIILGALVLFTRPRS
ncbi:MAG: hypothetical protein CML17_00800 [Pusillimonas sp.]|nr:hypothetical protein [Pusillimonas sp.]